MFAPRPGLLKAGLGLLNTVSVITRFSEEGKGPWNQDKDGREHYDYIVLGGGSAGCVVASRLAEDPNVKVLVLEAGYSDELMTVKTPAVYLLTVDTATDWKFVTTPQPHAAGRKMKQPRGKVLGGTSSMNAMMYHRGPASDYDEWASFGNEGWTYKECLPYFKKSEGYNDSALPASHPRGPKTSRVTRPEFETFDPAYHGTEGPWQVTHHHLHEASAKFIQANVAEGVALNKDFNGASTLGVNKIQTFIDRDAVRSSLSRAFLKPEGVVPGGEKTGRGRVRVVYGAEVKRVLVQMRKGVKMATGVEFIDDKNVLRKVMAVREVLLCGGAFGSPHILLESGIGPAPTPSIPHIHTLPGVGQNLVDHLGISVVFKARNRCHTVQSSMSFSQILPTLLQYQVRGLGSMSSQIGEAANFLRLEDIAPEFVAREKARGTYIERASGPDSPHIEIIFAPYYVRKHATIMAPDRKNYYSMIALLLNPCSTGSVTIAPKRLLKKEDSAVESRSNMATVIDPNYFSESFDARVMAEAVKFIRRLARRMSQDPEVGGREVFPGEANIPDSDDAGLEKYVREYAETYYHPTSTCKMGPATDPMAVVDSRLNVHGIERLRVIDASVMPKLPAAHTCAPTVMIAEKAADYIKEDWQDPAARLDTEPTVARL